MTLNEYTEAANAIYMEQQNITRELSKLALSARALPTEPEFLSLMSKQWELVQRLATLNTQLMLGIMVVPKK